MVGQVLGCGHQVDCQQAIVRRLHAGERGEGAGRADRLRDRADPADARRVDQCVEGRMSGEDLLKPRNMVALTWAEADLAGLDFQLDFQVAFDPIERADQ